MTSNDEVSGNNHRFAQWHTNHFHTSSKYFTSAYFEDTRKTRLDKTVSRPVHDKFSIGAPVNYYSNNRINTQGNINRSPPLMFETNIFEIIKKKQTDNDDVEEEDFKILEKSKLNQLKLIIDNAIYGKKEKELSQKFINFKICKANSNSPIKIYIQTSLPNFLKRFDFLITIQEKSEKEEDTTLYLRFLPSNVPDLTQAFQNFDTKTRNETSLYKSFKIWKTENDNDDPDIESKDYICKKIFFPKKEINYEFYGIIKLQPEFHKTCVKLVNHENVSHYIQNLKDYRFYFSAEYEESEIFYVVSSIASSTKCIKLIREEEVKKFIEFLEDLKETKAKSSKYPIEYINIIKNVVDADVHDIDKILQLAIEFYNEPTFSMIWTKQYNSKVKEFDLMFTPLSMWKICCDMPFKEKPEEVQMFVEHLSLKKIKIYQRPTRIELSNQEIYLKTIKHIYVGKVKDENNILKNKNLNKLISLENIPDVSNLGEIIMNKLRGIRDIPEAKYDVEAKKFCRLILSESEKQFAKRFMQRYGQTCTFEIRHALIKYFSQKSLKKITSDSSSDTYNVKLCRDFPFPNTSINVKIQFGFMYSSQKTRDLFVYTTDYGIKLGIPLMYQTNLQIIPQLITQNDHPLSSESLFGSKYCVYIDSKDCKSKIDEGDDEEEHEIQPLFYRYKMYAIVLSLIEYIKRKSIRNVPLILAINTKKDEDLWRSQLSFVLKLFPVGHSFSNLSWHDPRSLALFQRSNVYEVVSIKDDGTAETASTISFGLLIRPFPTLEELTSMMRFLLEKGDQLFIEEHIYREPVVPIKNASSSVDFMCMDMDECQDDCESNMEFMMHDMEDESNTSKRSNTLFEDPKDTDDEESDNDM